MKIYGPTTAGDLLFFIQVAEAMSLSAAAKGLNLTPSAISKRLALMEARLGVTLIHRTTRRVGLTQEGQMYVAHARRIIADVEDMEQEIRAGVTSPSGLVRVIATPGFGRNYIAPLVSRFSRQCPEVKVQLDLTPSPPSLTDDSFDVIIQFGKAPDARVVSRLLAANRRILVASASYLARAGIPREPAELLQHNCIVLRQEGSSFGMWRLSKGRTEKVVKVAGNLTTNDGEIAVNWALDGHGIILRAEWDVAKYLRSGRLVQVLQSYQAPPADIFAVYPIRHQMSARVTALVEFLTSSFERMNPGTVIKKSAW
jgi:DNA-binding transcriptional LysR family regulator